MAVMYRNALIYICAIACYVEYMHLFGIMNRAIAEAAPELKVFETHPMKPGNEAHSGKIYSENLIPFSIGNGPTIPGSDLEGKRLFHFGGPFPTWAEENIAPLRNIKFEKSTTCSKMFAAKAIGGSCCLRRAGYISMKEIGLDDLIIEPTRIRHTFCAGKCNNRHNIPRMRFHKYLHSF